MSETPSHEFRCGRVHALRSHVKDTPRARKLFNGQLGVATRQVMRYGEDARADLEAAASEVQTTYDTRLRQLFGHKPVGSDRHAVKK